MLSTARHADVIIVGAGLAGLSAAHRLTSAGVSVSVLEAAPSPGGRMSTELTGGFRLDRAGGFLNTSYPELLRAPCLGETDLRLFSPGVLVHSGGRLHRTGEARGTRGAFSAARALRSASRAPLSSALAGSALTGGGRPGSALAGSALAGGAFVSGALDRARLGAALARLAATPVERLPARPEQTALAALRSYGLPPRTATGVLKPLLSALLSDPGLTTSSRCADLALRSYARGRLCVPAGGAGVLPERLAATLPPGTVCTGVTVTAASISSVTTAELGTLNCRALIVATDARSAARLLPGLRIPDFHPVTVLHHTAPAPPPTGAALVLDADRSGPVSHSAVMSEVDPLRAPDGRALISSTVLGSPGPGLERAARAQLAALHGTPTDDWELLAVHHSPDAVPAMPPPHDMRRPVRLLAGLYVCGDHRDTSTAQGALASGRRAAQAVMRDFGIKPDVEVDEFPLVA
ncbi:FAD-dependent oxidoreductase [Streptomyces sp. NBC_01020]|uniref:NAD(P)/FAD-dependent oxidoreductase n=1 Tax=Streptomyces sp. NBC_01020 TaxID=2903722 RepID=UPI0038683E5B|nr:FAD-dependent oxidoreductase [Streptomyces sp. NBC_01020]